MAFGHKCYITVSTVEQHLIWVYKKLNVTRRTDLPSELFRYDGAEPELVAGASPVAQVAPQ